MAGDATPRRVSVRAFAKLNLTLRVLGTRPDGYHELRTIFQALALHDTITFTAARASFTISCDDPNCPTDESNLVYRAADALWRRHGRRKHMPGVQVRLLKRIPVQAGLGGGSSNAAAALRALAVLWRLRIDHDQLESIGRQLGADVPFFFEGGTALGLDRGDLLFPLIDRPPAWVVVLRPPFGISTKEAFGWWDADGSVRGPADNDLEPGVVRRHPQIGALIARLRRAGAPRAAMSGSGSSVFGLFDSEAAARAAARRIVEPGVAKLVTRTITRKRFQSGSAVQFR